MLKKIAKYYLSIFLQLSLRIILLYTFQQNMKKYLQKLVQTQDILLKKLIKSDNQNFWDSRTQADKWSAHEHFAHLVCYQHIFYNRIILILETENPVFEKYEGNTDSDFLLFKTFSTEELWQDFKQCRKELIHILEKITKKQSKRTATHARYGTLHIEEWLTFFILHESDHIFTIFQLQKQSKFASNKPVETNNDQQQTTDLDQKQEWIEVYDSRQQATGQIVSRNEIHSKGLWHKTMHCWIIFKDRKGVDYVVFQRRSAWKDSDPNKFDTTAAGHYTADVPIAAQRFREINEELGLKVPENELIYAGTRINVEDFQKQFFNHEFQDVYFWVNATPLKNYVLQTEEVSGLIALEIHKGLELFTGAINKTTAKGIEVVYAEDGTTSYKNKTFSIQKDDFGQTLDNYFAKTLVLAQRILAGEKYILI